MVYESIEPAGGIIVATFSIDEVEASSSTSQQRRRAQSFKAPSGAQMLPAGLQLGHGMPIEKKNDVSDAPAAVSRLFANVSPLPHTSHGAGESPSTSI